jgi:hypothetical protein
MLAPVSLALFALVLPGILVGFGGSGFAPDR